MANAELKILDLVTPIGLFSTYHDDGFVESTREHTLKLYRQYGAKVNCDVTESTGGYVAVFGFLGLFGNHFHVYYKDFGFEPTTIFARAHEETHIVDETNNLDLLAQKILREKGVRIDFCQVDDPQVRADIGGLFALDTRAINFTQLRTKSLFPTYEKAVAIYCQGRR